MTKFKFDSSSVMWRDDAAANQYLITKTVEYLKDILQHRRYLYLNRIYECFGVVWNPDYENVCYRDLTKFNIYFEEAGGSNFIITIN